MKRWFLLSSLAVAVAALWVMAPVYQFFAHRGITPLPPWGWLTLEAHVPETHEVFDPRFEAAGNRALRAMAEYRTATHLPSLSAAVAVGTKPVWVGAVGFSDIAAATPATPDTLYRIGSSSKALTATALARLVERGELDLDQPISSYAARLVNPAWPDVTARQLASHSAGMPHYGENTDLIGLYRSIALNHHYEDLPMPSPCSVPAHSF